MAQPFTIRMKGMDKVLKKLKDFPVTLQTEIEGELKNGADEMAREAKADAPKDEGQIWNAISVQHQRLKHRVYMQKQHGVFMEFGTKGKFKAPSFLGSYPSRFRGKGNGTYKEALENMERWVKRKGITGTYSVKSRRRTGNKSTQEQQNKRAAYLILRKILREGLAPRPYFFPAFLKVRKRVVSRIKQRLKEHIRR